MTLTFSEYDPEQTAQFWEQQYAAMGLDMPKDSHSWYLTYYAWLQQHYNILLMIGMPFLAYGTFKAFRKRELSYAQHLIMALYYYAIIVMINIPILPFSKFGDLSDGFNQINFLIMPLWMGWVFNDFFKISYIKGVFMSIWAYIISQLAMVAFSIVLGIMGFIIGITVGYSMRFFHP